MNRCDAIHANHARAGDASAFERFDVIGKAFGVGVEQSRRNESLAPEQFEERAVCQAQHLLSVPVSFDDLGISTQCAVLIMGKRGHLWGGTELYLAERSLP